MSKITAEQKQTLGIPADVPVYAEDMDGAPAGMYLGLFHGREEARAEMDNWGHHGPAIGPLAYAHVTYMNIVRVKFTSFEAMQKYNFPASSIWDRGECIVELPCVEDMLSYGGRFYGDWSVFLHPVA